MDTATSAGARRRRLVQLAVMMVIAVVPVLTDERPAWAQVPEPGAGGAARGDADEQHPVVVEVGGAVGGGGRRCWSAGSPSGSATSARTTGRRRPAASGCSAGWPAAAIAGLAWRFANTVYTSTG